MNCVRYSPAGDRFVTVSSDKKVFVFDGLTGELIKEVLVNGHTGGISYCDWLENSIGLVTASFDKLIRVWDLNEEVVLKTLRTTETPAVEN